VDKDKILGHQRMSIYIGKNGLWLSLVERLVRDQEAVGSNPTSPIKKRRRQGRTLRLSDSPSKMNVCSKLTFLVVAIAALHLAAFSARGVQIDVYVARPPGVINFVYPEYPSETCDLPLERQRIIFAESKSEDRRRG
jgi:hypothetical protein